MAEPGHDLPGADPAPVRIMLRPIGTPMPLGFVGLACATATLACLNLGWLPVRETHQVALVLVAFAFPLQALAAFLCFLARDAPTGAAIGVLAGSWLTLGLLLLGTPAGARSQTVAVFLFAAAAALLPAVSTALLTKIVPALIITLAATRFVLTGLYERFGGAAWAHAAGWEGVVLACLALYGALASDLESARHRADSPRGRIGSGRTAFQPGSRPPVGSARTEPGVRQQL